jgi:hypothetical protein
VRADGVAQIVESGPERDTAIRLLQAKYPDYATWTTPFGAAMLMRVTRIASWTM